MIFPDKLIKFQDSIIAKSIFILKALEGNSSPPSSLFEEVKTHYEDISEFILALDVLFMLNKIKINDEHWVIELC